MEDLHFFLPPAKKVDPLSIRNLDRTFSEVDSVTVHEETSELAFVATQGGSFVLQMSST